MLTWRYLMTEWAQVTFSHVRKCDFWPPLSPICRKLSNLISLLFWRVVRMIVLCRMSHFPWASVPQVTREVSWCARCRTRDDHIDQVWKIAENPFERISSWDFLLWAELTVLCKSMKRANEYHFRFTSYMRSKMTCFRKSRFWLFWLWDPTDRKWK